MYGMCNRLECLCNGNNVNVIFCWCYDCMLYGSCCLYVFSVFNEQDEKKIEIETNDFDFRLSTQELKDLSQDKFKVMILLKLK